MKYVILVGDGMAGYPIAELGDRTTLESANIPTIDYLSSKGKLYTLRTVPIGYPPGSDVANLSLVGYRPEKFYTGRAPLEAASMNVGLAPGETAFRCNLVNIDRSADGIFKMVDYSAGHISTEEAAELMGAIAAELNNQQNTFHAGISYRHLLVSTNEYSGLQTVPPHDFTDKDVTGLWNDYQKTAFGLLMSRCSGILENHPVNLKRIEDGQLPANSIWLWGEGKAPQMPTLNEMYGVSGALISAVDLLKGIAVYAGMKVINVDGATGYLDTNYQGKADAALHALENHDLVFVHVEAPDEAGHQGLLPEKMQAIEDFDSKIVKPILDGLSNFDDFRLAITPDHYTPLTMRTHASHPVPLIIFDSRQTSGCGMTYNEKNAGIADNLLADGNKFMSILLEK